MQKSIEQRGYITTLIVVVFWRFLIRKVAISKRKLLVQPSLFCCCISSGMWCRIIFIWFALKIVPCFGCCLILSPCFLALSVYFFVGQYRTWMNKPLNQGPLMNQPGLHDYMATCHWLVLKTALMSSSRLWFSSRFFEVAETASWPRTIPFMSGALSCQLGLSLANRTATWHW